MFLSPELMITENVFSSGDLSASFYWSLYPPGGRDTLGGGVQTADHHLIFVCFITGRGTLVPLFSALAV